MTEWRAIRATDGVLSARGFGESQPVVGRGTANLAEPNPSLDSVPLPDPPVLGSDDLVAVAIQRCPPERVNDDGITERQMVRATDATCQLVPPGVLRRGRYGELKVWSTSGLARRRGSVAARCLQDVGSQVLGGRPGMLDPTSIPSADDREPDVIGHAS